MSSYTLELELLGNYTADMPGFEIWEDGVLDSSYSISSSGTSVAVTISYGSDIPSSLEFKFNDSSIEVGRTIEVHSVKINDRYVNTGNYLSSSTLTNGDSATVNIADSAYIFDNAADPSSSEFTTGATQTFTAGSDYYGNHRAVSAQIMDMLGGDDYAHAGSGDDKINGGAGNDVLRGNGGDDLLFGAAGNDRLFGGDGADRLYGGGDDDLLYGNDGDDEMHGGAGDDKLFGHADNDTITGGDGNDKLSGGRGDDVLYGDAGDDSLIGGAGDDTLDGGSGDDLAYGGAGDDHIDGGAGADKLAGMAGVDTINGGADDDTIYLMVNDFAVGERIYGGTGTDDLILYGAVTVDFTTGVIDELETLTGSNHDQDVTIAIDVLDQFTSVDLGGHTSGDTIRTQIDGTYDAVTNGVPTVTNVENGYLTGSANADVLTASGEQVNSLVYGTGTIDMGAGADVLNLTSTSTTLNTLGATDGSVVGLETIDASTAAAGVDIELNGQTEDLNVTGSANADMLITGSGDDVIDGGSGNDVLYGGAGADTIYGGMGNDVIHGDEFDIASITGNVLWLDGADKSTILDAQGDSADSGAAFSGSVSTWTDKSGGGNNASGSSATLGDINGLSTVNITDDIMTAADVFGGSTSEMHVFTMLQENVRSHNNILNFSGGSLTTTNRLSVHAPWADASGTYYWDAGDTSSQRSFIGGNATDVGDVTQMSFYKTVSGDENGLSLNKGEYSETNTGAVAANTVGGLVIGGRTTDHEVAELIVFDRKLSAAEADEVEQYLMDKWLRGNLSPLGAAIGSNDVLDGGGGDDVIYGYGGDDTLTGGVGNDTLNGGAGNDTLNGGAGNDVLYGGAGNDVIDSGAGDDTVIAGSGNDSVTYSFGVNNFDGGDGVDLINASFRGGSVTINLETGIGTLSGNTSTLSNFEKATGGYRNDTLIGNSGDNVLYGNQGDDRITGRGGDDTMNGGSGTDTAVFEYDFSAYTISVSGDTVTLVHNTSGETDTATLFENFEFSDGTKTLPELTPPLEISSNGGNRSAGLDIAEGTTTVTTVTASETVTYSISGGLDAALFTINASTGALSFLAAPDYEKPTDSGRNNIYDVEITASNGGRTDVQSLEVRVTDVVEGDIAGSIATTATIDVGGVFITDIETAGDHDYIAVDLIAGQSYSIILFGAPTGAGTNVDPELSIYDSSGAFLQQNSDAGIGYEAFIGFSGVTYTGTYYIDTYGYNTDIGSVRLEVHDGTGGIFTPDATNARTLNGTSSFDFLESGSGDDFLYGNNGDDILSGNAGNDLLDGGAGNDTLFGGSGADTFMLTATDGSDRIVDFTTSEGDALDLSSIITGFNSLSDDIDDFVQFTTVGTDTVVLVDTDGQSGGVSFTAVATLSGETGEVVQTLYDNGDIIV